MFVVQQHAVLQLRDLVPPSSPANSSQQDGLDNKRPKHVVLSDTIALVKELQDKVCFLPVCTAGCKRELIMLTDQVLLLSC